MPEGGDAEQYENHPRHIMRVNAVAAWKFHDHHVPAVRTEVDYDGTEQDREGSDGSNHFIRTPDRITAAQLRVLVTG